MALEALNTASSTTPPHTSSFHLDNKRDLDTYAKGKRSKRPRTVEAVMTEEEYLAFCLVMLAQGSTEQPRQRVTLSREKILPSNKESATSPTEQLSHKCSVCGRCFSSYQALGGHKASHRDGGDKSNNANKSKSSAAAAGKTRHECSVCHRCFPTGQALGGHMRRHYEGGNKNNSTGVDTSSGSGVTHLKGFDLNFPPAFGGDGDDDVEVESPHPLKKHPRPSLFDL